jgi:hypothetical protein
MPRRSQKVTKSISKPVSFRCSTVDAVACLSQLTFTSLGKQEVGLRGSRQIGHTVTGVQENWAFTVRQSSVGLDLNGLVVAEVTRKGR